MNLRDTINWKKGHEKELLVRQLLQRDGYYVIPSFDYCGENGDQAPSAQALADKVILPDLDIAKDGKRLWAEVKTKEHADFTRITQQWEHGIPLRHWEAYRKIQDETGAKVWLYICEINSGWVLRAPIDNLCLEIRIYRGDKMNKGGMAFFPRNIFEKWRRLE